jgi:integrase
MHRFIIDYGQNFGQKNVEQQRPTTKKETKIMPRRGENIRKRADGRWEGRYKHGVTPNGKTRYRSVYGHSYREVKQRLRVAESTLQPEPKGGDLCFRDVLRDWQQARQPLHKAATEARYDYLIQAHILPELGDLPLSSISAQTINDFKEKKLREGGLRNKAGLSPAYVRSILLIVTSALKYAEREALCPPLHGTIHKPMAEKKELAVLSCQEQQQLQQYLVSHMDATALGVLLSLNTGLRIGEVCALTWKDVDFQRKLLHVRATVARVKSAPDSPKKTKWILDKPKTASSLRDIPIPSKLTALLHSRKDQATSAFVISDSASFLSPRTLSYRYGRLLARCGMAPLNYHALRHTFATRCIELGMDVKSLSEILGHANVAITLNTYVHPSMDRKRMEMEKLSDL